MYWQETHAASGMLYLGWLRCTQLCPGVAIRSAVAAAGISQNSNKILEATRLKSQTFVVQPLRLRHTAILFQLWFGKGIDLLTLARHARASLQMVEPFYVSSLAPERNIESCKAGDAMDGDRRNLAWDRHPERMPQK